MATVTARSSSVRPVRPAPAQATALVPAWYALTLFVSAALLFLVQPMFAKMVLPLLGGAPAVWNTCMVFYQAALLAGYAYAHYTTACLGVRRQALLHLGVLLLPLLCLPIAVANRGAPPGEANPIPWLLAVLALSVGLPFVVVSTSGPLLQKWFAATGHPSARDPYFLYGASNLGSMLALFAYPALVEPHLRLTDQSGWWALAYGLLIVLTVGCAFLLWRSPAARTARASGEPTAPSERPPLSRRLRWVALALVPSSLMLGVTTHLTTDVAAIPLLWVVPLALYLLTFILVFAPRAAAVHVWMVHLMPVAALLLLAKILIGLRLPFLLDVGLNLAGFFVISMACHGELARLRPGPEYLTGYYLLMSLGGVLGGLVNALVAPLVFNMVLEYPLALVAACLLQPVARRGERGKLRRADFGVPLLVGALAALNSWVWVGSGLEMADLARQIGDGLAILLRLGMSLVPVVLCYQCSGRPLRFGLAAGALLAAGLLCYDPRGYVQFRQRSFFGQVVVQHDPAREYFWLVHGTTLHGQQSLDPARREEPLTYYHHTGPAGQVFTTLGRPESARRVGVLGLGAGTLACYAAAGQEWTFYEIDPVVIRIAEDPRYFTFLADGRGRGADLKIVLGDARLELAKAPERAYDVLVVDVFSSDSVPVHLVSYEAFQFYASRLEDRGVLLLNISNHYLEMEPVLARLAQEAGWTGYVRDDNEVEGHPGKQASKWVVMARRPEVLGPLTRDGQWRSLEGRSGVGLWTDDFSNLLSVFQWRR
jgi:hypothetical protein